MSTRSCIARLTGKGKKRITFRGTYHQWDGYPNGLGCTLFQLRNSHFKGDTEAMLKMLIDDCPQGWSTINGADFNLPPAPRIDMKLEICRHCGLPNWRHYSQYYKETNEEWVKAGKPVCPPTAQGYLAANHSPEAVEKPHGPECYPASEKTSPMTARNASACGCEYVYAFAKDNRTMYVLSSYCSDDESKKMIGMFGMGDPKAKWKVIGQIDLDGIEPTEKQWGEVPIVQPTRKPVTEEEFRKDISK